MKQSTLYSILRNSAIFPSLNTVLKTLYASTIYAVVSAITMLLGFWTILRLLSNDNVFWIYLVSALWITSGIFAGLSSYFAHNGEAKFSADLRRRVAKHIARLPASKLSKHDDTQLKQLISTDIANLHHMLAHLPGELVTFIVVPIISIGFLIILVGLNALWVLVPAIIASLYYLTIVPKVTARDDVARVQVMSNIITEANDYARGIKIHRTYGGQNNALNKYYNATDKFSNDMTMWVGKVAGLAALATALLQPVATFTIAYIVSYGHDIITLASTLLFSLAMVTPVLRLGHGLDYIATAKISAKNLIDFFNEPTLNYANHATNTISPPVSIQLSNIKLSTDEKVLINGLTHHFKTGTISAITAPSGKGKTTLLNCLAGYELCTQGEIYFNSTPISKIDENSLNQTVLLIPQGADVLDATVEDNLKLVNDKADNTLLNQALHKAQLDNIDLNSKASILSGGEKQRLSVAKAFLTNASVILLDEPTSALDKNNANKLMNELKNLSHYQQKTIIMVTHDLEIVDYLDGHLILSALADKESHYV